MRFLFLIIMLSSCAPKTITTDVSCTTKYDALLKTPIEESTHCVCTCPKGTDFTTTAGIVGGILNLFGVNNQ